MPTAVLTALVASATGQRQFDALRKRGLPADSDKTQAVALGDVDGDGDLDLVLGNAGHFLPERNKLYLNNGTGTFVQAGTLPADLDDTRAVALGDVDGDGDLDLILGNSGQQNRLYLNQGSGVFVDATNGRMPADGDRTRDVDLADLDGDGDLDLFIGNFWGRKRMYLNDGAGVFTDVTLQRLPDDGDLTEDVALGDVDGNQDVDVFFNGNLNGPSRLYLNNGSGFFTDVTATQMPAPKDFSLALALSDLDSDGDLDLVSNGLYLNDGTGVFANAPSGLALGSYAGLALGDVDGDGDTDIASGHPGGAQNRLHLNDGTGRFTEATAATRNPETATIVNSVAIGDVDIDGDLDIVSAPNCGAGST